jgi:hypothetical protein
MAYKNAKFSPPSGLVLEKRIAELIEEFIKKGRVLQYGTLGERLNILPRHKSVARALGNLVREDVRNGRPIRSSIVVRADTGIPGRGFFYILRELGFDIPTTEAAKQAFARDRRDEVLAG